LLFTFNLFNTNYALTINILLGFLQHLHSLSSRRNGGGNRGGLVGGGRGGRVGGGRGGRVGGGNHGGRVLPN